MSLEDNLTFVWDAIYLCCSRASHDALTASPIFRTHVPRREEFPPPEIFLFYYNMYFVFYTRCIIVYINFRDLKYSYNLIIYIFLQFYKIKRTLLLNENLINVSEEYTLLFGDKNRVV